MRKYSKNFIYLSKENVMNTHGGKGCLTHPYGWHYKLESRIKYLVGRKLDTFQVQALCNSHKYQQRGVSRVQKSLAGQCTWQLVQNCSKLSG